MALGWLVITLKTDWRSVLVLLLAGLIAACQVGKAAIAVPLLRQDLGLSLVMASWVVGAYGVLGALAGLPAGIGVSRIGARAAVIIGLLAIATGSGLGAFAATGAMLLASRVLEGCGFLGLVVAAPVLLRNLSAPRDHEIVLTCWSAYMPGGTALMMLIGPLLSASGWQALWLANGFLAAIAAGVVWLLLPSEAGAVTREPAGRAPVGDVLTAAGPVLLALAFGIYTFHYFALTGLLPTLLVERMGLSVGQAGAVSAVTVVANAFGNLTAGIFLRLTIPLWAIMAAAFGCLGLASIGIFSATSPVGLVGAVACVSLGVSGLVPGSIFAATPRVARQSAMLAVTLGLLVQASNLGQVFGPAALGAWVDKFGWSTAPVIFLAIGAGGVAIALRLRGLLRTRERP
jgi:MFS family permease